jgi:hypothetical protein
MGRSNFVGHQSAYFAIPVNPRVVASFRRSNLIIILCLTFIVLGVFVMGLTPEAGHASFATNNIPLKIGKTSAPRLN